MFKTHSLINNIALVTFVLIVAMLGVFLINVYIWSRSVRVVYFPQETLNKNEAIDEQVVNEARQILLP